MEAWRAKLDSFLNGNYEFRPEMLPVQTNHREDQEQKRIEKLKKKRTRCKYWYNGEKCWAEICMYTGEIFINGQVVRRCHVERI